MIGCECEVCTSPDKKDKRLRSSILVQSSKTTLVVDTGPDFRYQMLRQKIKHLDAVVFTHPHKDHLAGLDDIKAFNFFTKKPMQVYADSLTEEALRRDFYYAFSDTKYPGIPELNLNTITLEPFVCWRYSHYTHSCLAFKNAGPGFPVWQIHLYHRCQPD